jgi:hypothetical protein
MGFLGDGHVSAARQLISFDIDGTLEFGDPPGPLRLEVVRLVRDRGHLVGSASDRTLREQRELWAQHDMEVDFVSHKHHLDAIRNRFDCIRFVHIGDTPTDKHYALQAGFQFWFVLDLPVQGPEEWILGVDPAGELPERE